MFGCNCACAIPSFREDSKMNFMAVKLALAILSVPNYQSHCDMFTLSTLEDRATLSQKRANSLSADIARCCSSKIFCSSITTEPTLKVQDNVVTK